MGMDKITIALIVFFASTMVFFYFYVYKAIERLKMLLEEEERIYETLKERLYETTTKEEPTFKKPKRKPKFASDQKQWEREQNRDMPSADFSMSDRGSGGWGETD